MATWIMGAPAVIAVDAVLECVGNVRPEDLDRFLRRGDGGFGVSHDVACQSLPEEFHFCLDLDLLLSFVFDLELDHHPDLSPPLLSSSLHTLRVIHFMIRNQKLKAVMAMLVIWNDAWFESRFCAKNLRII
jgi:hypothetical protein